MKHKRCRFLQTQYLKKRLFKQKNYNLPYNATTSKRKLDIGSVSYILALEIEK